MIKKLSTFAFLIIAAEFANSVCPVFSALAQEEKVVEIQSQIEQKNQEIKKIEEEISGYKKEIDKTAEEAKTLKNEVSKLTKTGNKLNAEINLTAKQIENTNLLIEKLDIDIQGKTKDMGNAKNSLAEILRKLNEEESKTLVEILLAEGDISDFFSNLESMEYLQKDINDRLENLRMIKYGLEKDQDSKESEKSNLENLQDNLSDQKKIVQTNKKQKDTLLVQTKNKEENYKKILEEKTKQKKLFLDELANLEAALQIEIDPGRIPLPGTGILGWPFENASLNECTRGSKSSPGSVNCITQFFGNTPFATQNPQVYGGTGHNGIDFRAYTGTKVLASAQGVVEETGNTDEIPGCYSYGKWVLIRHNNGLSTLYAHLSLIKVSEGEQVVRGQTIGYSGETGYATGPHLHYTVYATQGVQVVRLGDIKKSKTPCSNARMPIADKKAYLNPLSYL
ncbi:MAG: peptidoglycan DD-metalloendopeptidase family protein [Candidatus Pacebacteria bacterium]|nr:peptidoglycan DD-metalloendopeptidase family protein [Candidatus Paceibacterota bacterium]